MPKSIGITEIIVLLFGYSCCIGLIYRAVRQLQRLANGNEHFSIWSLFCLGGGILGLYTVIMVSLVVRNQVKKK